MASRPVDKPEEIVFPRNERSEPIYPECARERSLLGLNGSINSLLLLLLYYIATTNSSVSHTYVLYILLLIAFIIRTQKLDPNKDPKD